MIAKEPFIQLVQKWISDVVVGLNFCPFASKPLQTDKIHFEVVNSGTLKTVLEAFARTCNLLSDQSEIDTAIIILPEGFTSFNDYLQLVEYCEVLIEKEGYAGVYQVASFHPEYVFHGSEESDPANYTNRSPYPLLHILREEMLEKALEKYPHPEKIPENNIALTRKLGLEHMKSLFNTYFNGGKANID
jgi:hypothetical protein